MTKHIALSLELVPCLLVAVGLISCNGSDSGNAAKRDASLGANSGGSSGTAGVPTSSVTASGGSTTTSGGNDGVQPVGGSGGTSGSSLAGGSSSAAGATSMGGSASSGGTASTGGSGGGTSNLGGSSPKGGTTSAGDSRATGGTSSTGGSEATGGTPTAGGSGTTGGSSAQGGTTGVGETTTTGGRASTGGSSGGSQPVGSTAGGVTTGGTTSAGGIQSTGGAGAGGSTHTGVWKFMPFGDSITADTCYPQLLSQEFKTKGHTNFQFVGTNLNDQSCNGAPNVQTEGHGGYLVTFLTTNSPSRTGLGTLSQLQTWVAEKPDMVLMHYGTNDVWSSVATGDIMSAYVFVINQFRSQNPNVIFFVSKIISMNPSGCSTCAAGVTALDAAITEAWASANSTSTSPIFIVDQSNAVNTSTQTVDGVHPNIAGATNMADNAYAAVSAQNYF